MKKAKTILLISAFLLTFIVTKQINVMQDTTIWKAVPGFETFYEISNTGLIRNSKGKILSSYLRTGYHAVTLKDNKNYFVHRLLAIAFIDNPLNKPQVNHINGVKTDISLSNLEWVTCSENRSHAFKIGLCSSLGSKNPSVRLTENQVIQIRKRRALGHSIKRLSFDYRISDTQIWRIIKRERWGHV